MHLKATIIPGRDVLDSIAIIVILDSLHNDFEPTIASPLEREKKPIEEIQQILSSTKAKLKSKQTISAIIDLARMS